MIAANVVFTSPQDDHIDKTAYMGSDEAVMPWGFLGGLAATLSVIVAASERMASRLLGGAMLSTHR